MQAAGSLLKRALWTCAVVGWTAAAELHAQAASGKLQGRILDQAGGTLASAQAYLVGTSFSAVTDSRGLYFINNIPAGSWTVRAIFLGHSPVEARDLRILDGQTITQDFVLASAPLQLQEITVLAAQNALVPRDEVTTKQRVDGQFADELPVDRMDQILALQPGVVDASASAVFAGAGHDTPYGLSIRGSRRTHNATYIDGVPVQPGYEGDRILGWRDLGSTGSSVILGTNALEEASVTTGSPSAEFGNAGGGIISLVTRAGGPKFS